MRVCARRHAHVCAVHMQTGINYLSRCFQNEGIQGHKANMTTRVSYSSSDYFNDAVGLITNASSETSIWYLGEMQRRDNDFWIVSSHPYLSLKLQELWFSIEDLLGFILIFKQTKITCCSVFSEKALIPAYLDGDNSRCWTKEKNISVMATKQWVAFFLYYCS